MNKYTKALQAMKRPLSTTTSNTATETPPPAVGGATGAMTTDNSMVSSGSVNQDYAGLFDKLINQDPNSSSTGQALNAEILQGLSGQGSSALHNAKRIGAEMLSRKAQDLRGQAGEQIAQAGLVGQGAGNSIGNKAEGAILQATADLGNNIAMQASKEQQEAQAMALNKGTLDESSRSSSINALLQNKAASANAAKSLYDQYADARDKNDTANAAMINKKYIEMTGFSAEQVQTGKTYGADAQKSNQVLSDLKNIIGSDANALDNAKFENGVWIIGGKKDPATGATVGAMTVDDPAAMDFLATQKIVRDDARGASVQASMAKLDELGDPNKMTNAELNALLTTDNGKSSVEKFVSESKSPIPTSQYTDLGDGRYNSILSEFGLIGDADNGKLTATKLVRRDGKLYKVTTSDSSLMKVENGPDRRKLVIVLTPIDGGTQRRLQFGGINTSEPQ